MKMASMPRRPRIAPGGLVYHVLKCGVARLALFEKAEDDDAFECVLSEALIEHPTRQTDDHFYSVLRYVERNPLRATRRPGGELALEQPVAQNVRDA